MTRQKFETADYYRGRAQRLRDLAGKDRRSRVAKILNETAEDFDIVARIIDHEETTKPDVKR